MDEFAHDGPPQASPTAYGWASPSLLQLFDLPREARFACLLPLGGREKRTGQGSDRMHAGGGERTEARGGGGGGRTTTRQVAPAWSMDLLRPAGPMQCKSTDDGRSTTCCRCAAAAGGERGRRRHCSSGNAIMQEDRTTTSRPRRSKANLKVPRLARRVSLSLVGAGS